MITIHDNYDPLFFSGSVDEIPTRDAGLTRTLNSSFADTLNFSESMQSEAIHHQSAIDSVRYFLLINVSVI